jgi:hypothetical protein
MPVIVVTRLRLRDAALLDEFFTHAVAVMEQATHSEGNLGADALAEAHDVWWSVTAWQDRNHMKAFVDNEPHLSTASLLDHLCDEATFVDWGTGRFPPSRLADQLASPRCRQPLRDAHQRVRRQSEALVPPTGRTARQRLDPLRIGRAHEGRPENRQREARALPVVRLGQERERLTNTTSASMSGETALKPAIFA